MTRELYGWKPTTAASLYIKEQEDRAAIERRAAECNYSLDRSRDWLAAYHANPQPSRFNWSGRFSTITMKDIDHAEAEETFLRTSQAAAEVDLQQGLGDAAQECEASSLAGGEAGAGDLRGQLTGCAAGPESTDRNSVSGGDERSGAPSRREPEHDWLNDPIPF